MADVTGSLGGQDLVLNNAATESTLKQLVQAIAVMSARMGKDIKSQKDLDKELKKFYKQLGEGAEPIKRLTKAQEKEAAERAAAAKKLTEEKKARLEAIDAQLESNKQVEFYADVVYRAASNLTGLMNEFASLGDSMTSTARTLGNIPIAGSLLSAAFGGVAQSAEGLLKAFQQSASIGANFGGSITTMVASATQAGLTFDQFAGIISRNGENLAFFGKGTGDGAKRLGEVGRAIRGTGLADELARMGYSTEEINEGIASFGGRLARTGALQNKTATEVAQITGQYLKELDAVSKLTGESKKALQEQEAARMRDAQYLNFKMKLDEKGQKNLELLMATIPEGMRKGAQEFIATGTATTEAGEAFMAYMNRTGQDLTKLGFAARKSGTIQIDQVKNVADRLQEEARQVSRSGFGDTVSSFIPAFNDVAVAAINAGNRTTTFSQEIDKSVAAEQERERKRRESLDPAGMQRFQQSIAEINNRFSVMLAQYLPKLVTAFDNLAGFVENILVPVFKVFMDHIGKIVAGFIILKTSLMAFNAYLKVQQLKELSRGTLANPMIVRDISGGLGKGGAGGLVDLAGGKGGAGKAGKIANLAKGAALFTVLSAASGYATDAVMDATGSSQEVTAGMEDQDEANWKAATGWEKVQSALPRAIEGIGSFLGFTKLTETARADRIKAETEYLKKQGRLPNKDSNGKETVSAAPTPAAGTKPESPKDSTSTKTVAAAEPKNYNDPASLARQELMQQRNKEIQAKLKEIEKAKEEARNEKPIAPEEEKAKQEATKLQERTASELAELNKNMQALIQINKNQALIGEQQLDVQRSLGGDLFFSA